MEENGASHDATALTSEDRSRLLGHLVLLQDTDETDAVVWKTELASVLKPVPMLAPFCDALNALDVTTELDNATRSRMSALVKAAIRVVDPNLGTNLDAIVTKIIAGEVKRFEDGASRILGETEHIVARKAEAAIWESSPMRYGRFLLPTVAVLLCGGLLFGTYNVKGWYSTVQQLAETSANQIKQSREDVDKQAADATSSLQTIQAHIGEKVNNQIKQEVRDQTVALASFFTKAQDKARTDTAAQLKDLETTLAQLKGQYDMQAANLVATQKTDLAAVQAKLHDQTDAAFKDFQTNLAQLKGQYSTQFESSFATQKADIVAAQEKVQDQITTTLKEFQTTAAQKSDQFSKSWSEKEEQVLSAAEDKKGSLFQHLDQKKADADSKMAEFQYRLNTASTNANQQVPDLIKQMNELRPQVASIRTLLAAQDKMNDLIDRLNRVSVGGHVLYLVRILQWTDFLSVGAIILSTIALGTVLFARFVRPRQI